MAQARQLPRGTPHGYSLRAVHFHPRWASIQFRLAFRTYAPCGPSVRVVSQTKSRKLPTRDILPLFFLCAQATSGGSWRPLTRPPYPVCTPATAWRPGSRAGWCPWSARCSSACRSRVTWCTSPSPGTTPPSTTATHSPYVERAAQQRQNGGQVDLVYSSACTPLHVRRWVVRVDEPTKSRGCPTLCFIPPSLAGVQVALQARVAEDALTRTRHAGYAHEKER